MARRLLMHWRNRILCRTSSGDEPFEKHTGISRGDELLENELLEKHPGISRGDELLEKELLEKHPGISRGDELLENELLENEPLEIQKPANTPM